MKLVEKLIENLLKINLKFFFIYFKKFIALKLSQLKFYFCHPLHRIHFQTFFTKGVFHQRPYAKIGPMGFGQFLPKVRHLRPMNRHPKICSAQSNFPE